MKQATNAGLVDQQIFKSDYLIPREEVNRFQHEVKSQAKERKAEACKEEEECEEDEVVSDSLWVGLNIPGDPEDGQDIETPCAKNWRAAQENKVHWQCMTLTVAFQWPVVMASLKYSVRLCKVVNCKS